MLGTLRPYVGAIKRLLAWPYLQLGFSAVGVGIFGVALALFAAVLFRLGVYEAAFWLALFSVLTDLVDGEVARVRGEAGPRGNYLDAFGDRIREGVLLIGLLPVAPNLVALSLLGTFLTSFAKARLGLVLICDNRDWPGLGDHADRAALLALAYFFAPNSWPVVGILCLVTLTCAFHRTQLAVKAIEKAPEERILPYLRD